MGNIKNQVSTKVYGKNVKRTGCECGTSAILLPCSSSEKKGIPVINEISTIHNK